MLVFPFIVVLLSVFSLTANADEVSDAELYVKKQEAFLLANSKKDDVVTLSSGLQYKVLEEGPGTGQSPTLTTNCACNYKGTTIDGAEFDSSYSRGSPSKFRPSQVIKGWTEALQIMKEGDKWELYIPAALAYGSSSPTAKIPANSALIFTLHLVEIDPAMDVWDYVGFLSQPVYPPLPFNGWHVIIIIAYIGLKMFNSNSDVKVTANHILVETEDECKKIMKEIDSKKITFEDAAKKYSTCPSGKSSGGSLGAFSPGSMVAEFDAVCFDKDTEIGKVYGPVKTQFGFHLINVTSRVDPKEKKE